MEIYGLISGIYPARIYLFGSFRYREYFLAIWTYVLFAALTLTTFLLIEMRIGMWSELRAGCVAHSVHKSNDGLAIVMSGKLLTVGVILLGKSSFSTP